MPLTIWPRSARAVSGALAGGAAIGARGLVVEVHLLPLLLADGSGRRALAAGAQAAVTAATLPPTPQLVAAAPALRAA